MTTVMNEMIHQLPNNESTKHGILMRSILAIPSLDDEEGPDDVFEDDFDSLQSFFRTDVPAPESNENISVWEHCVSYFWKFGGYFWRSNSSSSTSSVTNLVCDIETFL